MKKSLFKNPEKKESRLWFFTSKAPEDNNPEVLIMSSSLRRAMTIAIRKFLEYQYVGTPVVAV